jgi:ferritin-like protein
VGSNHFLSGRDGRRGFGRAAPLLCAGIAAAALLAGCGGSGHGAETDPEKASDAAVLNDALSQETTAVEAYAGGLPLLHGRVRAVGREFHAQEQEYVDAVTKAIRGLGGSVDAEHGQPELAGVNDQAGFLALAYEMENAALASYLDAAPRLNTSAPRGLAASLAAAHAQHLVVLRQALGAGLASSVPRAFDGGEEPPPAGAPPRRGR